jgi:hypothetical protein
VVTAAALVGAGVVLPVQAVAAASTPAASASIFRRP